MSDKMIVPTGEEPAFPFWTQGPTTAPETYYGITMRDWFASMAVKSLIARYYDQEDVTQKDIAKWAYDFADVMLQQREERSQ